MSFTAGQHNSCSLSHARLSPHWISQATSCFLPAQTVFHPCPCFPSHSSLFIISYLDNKVILGPVSHASPPSGTPAAFPNSSPSRCLTQVDCLFGSLWLLWLTLPRPSFTTVPLNSACLRQSLLHFPAGPSPLLALPVSQNGITSHSGNHDWPGQTNIQGPSKQHLFNGYWTFLEEPLRAAYGKSEEVELPGALLTTPYSSGLTPPGCS